MRKHPGWMVGWAFCFLTVPSARGSDPPAPTTAADQDLTALAAKIDRHFAASWAAAKVQPAPPADDAEFLRRTYLNLIGRIPSVTEARTFLNDPRPDKRRRLAAQLLAGPGYANYFTTFWRALLIPETDPNVQGRFGTPGFEAWLRQQLAANVGYDQMVRALLTTPVANNVRVLSGDVVNLFGGENDEISPLGYYLAKEGKPENLAANTARVFLGIRLECAQCHHHPFAVWKREQFWGLAAFFAGLDAGNNRFPAGEQVDRREIAIPGTDRVVRADFLDGGEPIFKYKTSSRVALADWLTSPRNPYFARAAVNRLWAHFFGTGLTEPVDDMAGQESVAHHPQLLDELAREFAAHRFDLQFLMKAITASRVFQLTSAASHPSQHVPHHFARMAVKGMSAEQLFDSLVQATGYQEPADAQPFLGEASEVRSRFLEKFDNHRDKPTETATTVVHALALMNGKFTADATSVADSETLAAVIDAPFMDTAERIETLFLATLSRKPRPGEMPRLLKLVRPHGADEDAPEGLADVFWALLNSSEFILNH